MNKRRVIIIGGAPLSGKSTLASELSKKLTIPWVSTDDIRKWMQALVRNEDYPNLFDGHGLKAEAFYEKFNTAQDVFEQERKQGLDVQKGTTALIDNFWWWDKFIIEGIAVTPSYVNQLQESHPNIGMRAVFLIDRNPANIKQRLYERGLWGEADTYPDYIKPIELDWVIMFNRYYEKETQKYNFELSDISELHKLERRMVDWL